MKSHGLQQPRRSTGWPINTPKILGIFLLLAAPTLRVPRLTKQGERRVESRDVDNPFEQLMVALQGMICRIAIDAYLVEDLFHLPRYCTFVAQASNKVVLRFAR